MPRDARWSASALFLAIALAALLVPPPAVAGAALPQPAADAETADLASSLAADGTFLGVPGVNGTVDTTAWTLTSDLAAGEAPRFEPAGSTTQGGATSDVDNRGRLEPAAPVATR